MKTMKYFAFAVFATDTFKSDKELFYKYASKIDLNELFDINSYSLYQKRLENEGHANEGAFIIDWAESDNHINESIKYNEI